MPDLPGAVGQHLPWVATQQITTYWIRHTTLTWVEGTSALRLPRPTPATRNTVVGKAMVTYIRAGLPEVATALTASTGEPHPLAVSAPRAELARLVVTSNADGGRRYADHERGNLVDDRSCGLPGRAGCGAVPGGVHAPFRDNATDRVEGRRFAVLEMQCIGGRRRRTWPSRQPRDTGMCPGG